MVNLEKKVQLIEKPLEISFTDLYKQIKNTQDIEQCGAIVTFTGIVREITKKGKKVKSLHFEAARELAIQRMEDIRQTILKKYEEVKEVIIYHLVDNLKPQEGIMFVLTASNHRKQGFEATEEVIDLVKKKVPIWKKEIREDTSKWVSAPK